MHCGSGKVKGQDSCLRSRLYSVGQTQGAASSHLIRKEQNRQQSKQLNDQEFFTPSSVGLRHTKVLQSTTVPQDEHDRSRLPFTETYQKLNEYRFALEMPFPLTSEREKPCGRRCRHTFDGPNPANDACKLRLV